MSLYRISDRHPTYRQRYFDGLDLKGLPAYSADGAKSGYVVDILINETDEIAYLVLSVGSGLATWFGDRKKVVLPANAYRHHALQNRISIDVLTQAQIKSLPKYEKNQRLDDVYEAAISKETCHIEKLPLSV